MNISLSGVYFVQAEIYEHFVDKYWKFSDLMVGSFSEHLIVFSN